MKVGANYLGDNRCEFTVWAPYLDSIAVQLTSQENRLIPMEAQSNGYWQVVADDVPPGTCYLYQLNGGETKPDPASHFQPEGVHGVSQVVNHTFNWTDQSWTGVPLDTMILYELHVGTFTPEGTFEAIIPRLEELRSLGVNAIELMPIAQFPGSHPPEADAPQHDYRNWGYDGTYLYGVQNSYGGPDGLRRLVDACHQMGISLVLDVVYNHFGPEGNYINFFAPFFNDAYRTPWGSAINYDAAHSPEVRNFFIENALYWLRDYHIDGLRLDAVHAIYDYGAKHFLEELSEQVDVFSEEWGYKRYLIAESDLNDPRLIRPAKLGGYGLDAQWSDDFHHALHVLVTNDRTGYYEDFGQCEHLAKAYRDSFVYDWQYSPNRKRFHGRSACDRPPSQFVVCAQNHDQVGNRVLGERLAHLISFEALKLTAGALLLSPYIPLLFMGEEYGEEAPFTYFVSHSDTDLIRAVREGRKEEFAAFHIAGEPIDPEALNTFLSCKLNWEKRKEGKHQVLWSFHQHLIRLRNTLPPLVQRDRRNLTTWVDEEKRVMSWRRWSDTHQLLCLMNFNPEDVTVQPEKGDRHWRKVLDSADEKWMGKGSLASEQLTPEASVTLRSQSFALYEAI